MGLCVEKGVAIVPICPLSNTVWGGMRRYITNWVKLALGKFFYGRGTAYF